MKLLNDNKIKCNASIFLTYLLDGHVLNLPLAKSARNYKNPRWCPVTLSPIEKPTRLELEQFSKYEHDQMLKSMFA